MATPFCAFETLTGFVFYSCRQVYDDIKPKKRMVALRAAILFLGFAFVLIQSMAAIIHESVATLS
jgi:hypothetical protein